MNTSVTSSSSASSVTRPLCNCYTTNQADNELMHLFAPLFATQELALAAIRHFCVVDWLSSRTGFAECSPESPKEVCDTDDLVILSLKSINELVRKKHFIVLVKNFPVRKATDRLIYCFALPAVVVFTLEKVLKETHFTDYSPPEKRAVGYAVSRFPNISLIVEDKRNAFVYSYLCMNSNLVRTTSIDCSEGGVIGGGSSLGNWFLELMRGNSCFALANSWEWGGEHGCFYPNNIVYTTPFWPRYYYPTVDIDISLQKEIAAVPENTLSNCCLCAPVEPVGLPLLQTQILEHTSIPVTIVGMILSYLGSWSLPLGYVAHGRYKSDD